MATKHKDDSTNNKEPRQYSVWSDLRAMRLLSQVQKDIDALKASQARLRLLLTLPILILAISVLGLSGMLFVTYSQVQELQQLRQQNPDPTSQNSLDLKSLSS